MLDRPCAHQRFGAPEELLHLDQVAVAQDRLQGRDPGVGAQHEDAVVRLSGISCLGGHDGWKGAQPCRDAKSLIFLMPSWTSFWLGPIPRRPLIRTDFSTA